MTHGLKHYQAGRKVEALWWWQFSYLSVWGDQALASMRALPSVPPRLDADEERVSEAEFDALHPDPGATGFRPDVNALPGRLTMPNGHGDT